MFFSISSVFVSEEIPGERIVKWPTLSNKMPPRRVQWGARIPHDIPSICLACAVF